MKKIWRVLSIIVMLVLIVGLILIAVGVFTGADWNRIYALLDNRYHIEMYLQYMQEVAAAIAAQI